jgi:preprotein translocase subunit SecY
LTQRWLRIDRRRLLITALCVVAWRGLDQVQLVGIDPAFLKARIESLSGTGFFHGLGPDSVVVAPYSVLILGITPYVNALVIMTLVRAVSRPVREMAAGALERWTRVIAVALALGSAYGFTVLLQYEGALPSEVVTWFPRLVICLEMAAGTVVLVLLAQVVDEQGLGFGNGAILIFALGPVASEVHRLSGLFADVPSVDAIYLPVAIWAACSVVVASATVAAVLAVRRVRRIELRLLTSGVLRPPMFALALASAPSFALAYMAPSNPALTTWIQENWTPYGPNRWLDAAYVLLWGSLIVTFAFIVVVADLRGERVRRGVRLRIMRLTLLGGVFLALTCAVAPVLEVAATRAAGRTIGMSGYDIVLAVAIVLGVIMSIERRAHESNIPIPVPRLP